MENETVIEAEETGTDSLSHQEMLVAYYSYGRGILDGKGLPLIPNLCEAYALYAVTYGQGKPAQDLWDPFIESELGQSILDAAGIH